MMDVTLDSGVRPQHGRVTTGKSSGNVGADPEAPRFHASSSMVVKGAPPRRRGFWAAGIEEIYIAGSFCTEKPDPGDVDGYLVEPDEHVYDRIDPYWIDLELILVPHLRKRKWRMWADHGVEFFIHPVMQATAELGFPEFFRQDRDGRPRGIIQVVKAEQS
jgi:hypothetical protein